MKYTLFILVWLTGSIIALGNPTDSLETELKTATGERKVKVMNELFRSYINSDPVKAIGFTREALALALSINDQKGMAASYNNIGISYKNQGALDMALENYVKSSEIYTTLQNGEGMATTKNNIANIYMLKKDYSKALKYFEESHNGFIGLGDPVKIVGSMNNLGNLHSELQLYDQALTYYTEAYKMSEKSGLQFTDPLTNIGNLFFRQNNFERAVEYYMRAMEIAKSKNDRTSELSILVNIGVVYTKAKQPAEAQKYLDQAMALANELQASFYHPQILRSMATNYFNQGKAKEAYETMVKYDEAREKVYGEESTKKIAQMDVALELQEREKQVESLQQDDKIKTLRLRNTQIVITLIVIGLVAIVATANLVFLRKRMRGAKK